MKYARMFLLVPGLRSSRMLKVSISVIIIPLFRFPFPLSSLFLVIAPSVSGNLPVQKSSLFLLYDRAQAIRVEFMLLSPNVESNNPFSPSRP